MTIQESQLDYYQGETPRGSEGDAHVRKRISTGVLLTGDDDRELERAELNDLLGYLGFNIWDALAGTGTGDGPDPGPVPLAECEAFGRVQAWQRYPDLVRFITEQIGPDGVAEIGGASRREIGTKINRSHIWGVGVNPAFGRGVSMSLGQLAGHEREADLGASLQFARRLARGLWAGPGEPLFASMRGYAAPVLGQDWLSRFADERTPVGDRHRGFAGDLARLASLVHLGNRCATHDSGPYPAPGGGSVLVRDHFPAEDLYHWADAAAQLPHAITCVYFLTAGPEPALTDAGPTRPGELLDRVSAVAVYARDRWDTPATRIRLVDDAELEALADRCRAAATRIHRQVAAMSRRDKIMAGGLVQYLDFLAPFARAAGLWDRLRDEFDVYEWDPLASEAYYPLVTGGSAAEMVPRLISTGAGFPPVKDAISAEEAFPALHQLAVRGPGPELPIDPNDLVSAGLVAATGDGYVLTEAGHAAHQRQLAAERYSYEPTRLAQAYERFLAQDEPLRDIVARWDSADQNGRAQMFAELTDILGRVRVALRRTNEQLLRFEGYLPRLRKALGRVEQGEHDYLAGPVPDSFYTIWSELHQDYRITQG